MEFLLAAARKLGIKEFVFDLAADAQNAICPEFYDESDDALGEGVSWVFDGIAWLNPPFGKIGGWVKKACSEAENGATIAVLIPASIGARWWIDYVVGKCRIIPLDGRIVFVGQTDPYPKDCALLVYGQQQLHGYDPAWKWTEYLTEEEREMAKQRIGKGSKKAKLTKPQKKAKKKIAALVAKDRSKVTDIGTKKPRLKKGDGYAGLPVTEPARVTTFKPNGSTSQGLPSLSEFDPGKIELPSPEESQKVLAELASLNDQALKAHSRYEELKDYTKTAKDKYDALMKQVADLLRQATHASDLPLFADVEKREQDQAKMEAGPQQIPASEPDPAPASEPVTDEAGAVTAGDLPADAELPPPVSEPLTEALTASDLLADEQIPF